MADAVITVAAVTGITVAMATATAEGMIRTMGATTAGMGTTAIPMQGAMEVLMAATVMAVRMAEATVVHTAGTAADTETAVVDVGAAADVVVAVGNQSRRRAARNLYQTNST